MRGDAYLLKAPRGTRGSEQQGTRYAVVIQSDLVRLSTLLVAPTSRSARPSSFRPGVVVDGAETTLLLDQATAVDPARLGGYVGHLSHLEMAAVDRSLTRVLGLDAVEGPGAAVAATLASAQP